MIKRLSLLVVATSAVVFGCLVVPQGQVTGTKPKLVLVLSIDQMRFDYLTRFNSLYKGGLRRLLDQGAVFTNAKYRHANTETGPGHSVILSGRHASHSGIVANSWYDPLLKKSINVVEDPVQMPVGGKGTRSLAGEFHRVYGRGYSETGFATVQGRWSFDERSLGNSHGRTTGRRGLLV